MPILVLLLAVSVVAALFSRGWAVIPLSLLIPIALIGLGAFDDGEPVRDMVIFTVLFPACSAIGYTIGRAVFRNSDPAANTSRA